MGDERELTVGAVRLGATLNVPADPRGIVVFAHGSGSSRSSGRNVHVARILERARFATLLLDLLTEEEGAGEAPARFDVALLAERLTETVRWARNDAQTKRLAVGLFGASTGAAAALVAATREPSTVAAVVSRGGRPDLAGDALSHVRAPTLLIVGGRDYTVIDVNREALRVLRCEKAIEIVPYATHLFEEEGALDEVARLAAEWFVRFVR